MSLQRLETDLWHDVKQALSHEQTVGHERVQVGMEVQVIAEGVDRHDNAGMAVGKAERGAHVLDQALVGDAAVILEQNAIEPKIHAKHLGDTEREVAVRNGKQDRLGQQGTEELNLLLVAGRTEPATLT